MIRFGRHQPEPNPEPQPRKDYSPLGEIGLTTPPPEVAAASHEPVADRSSMADRPQSPDEPGPPSRPDGSGPRGPGRWRRWVVLALLALFVVGAGLFALTRRPPDVWRQYQHLVTQTTPEERQATIDAVMAKLEAKLQLDIEGSGIGLSPRRPGQAADVNPDSPFADLTPQQIAAIPFDKTTTITLANEELSAFTVQWFDTWVKQRGMNPPGELNPPIIVAMDGKLRMGFKAQRDNWSQIFSGEIRLAFREDGRAEGSVHGFTIGSLPVPLHQAGQVLSEDLDESTAQKVGQWLRKLERFEFRPVLELEHRRRARVTDLVIGDDDTVTLTLRVQDHETYRQHNTQMAAGLATPNGVLPTAEPTPPAFDPSRIADVPTTTE